MVLVLAVSIEIIFEDAELLMVKEFVSRYSFCFGFWVKFVKEMNALYLFAFSFSSNLKFLI
jgi:hypothetical protein